MSEGRCTGHCCKRFTLPMAPDELEEKRSTVKDGEQIWMMTIHLESNGLGHFYSCVNLLDNGDCGIWPMIFEVSKTITIEVQDHDPDDRWRDTPTAIIDVCCRRELLTAKELRRLALRCLEAAEHLDATPR